MTHSSLPSSKGMTMVSSLPFLSHLRPFPSTSWRRNSTACSDELRCQPVRERWLTCSRLIHGHAATASYMNTVLILQFMWSLGLACVDIFSLRNKKDLHDPGVITLIVFGDWIMSVLVFAGASASASLVILFTKDLDFCRVYWRLACSQFVLSTILAFMVWAVDAASSFSGFWLLVSFF